MRYFITLNIQSDNTYEKIIDIIEKNGFKVLGIEGVTNYQDSESREQSFMNAKDAMKTHKKGLRF